MPTIVSMTMLMALVCFFARVSDKKAKRIQTAYGIVYKEKLFTCLIWVSLSYYGAMRTRGNDTFQYIINFNRLSPTLTVREFFSSGLWSSEKGPIFSLLQVICKNYIADTHHVFFFAAGLVTNGLIVGFMRKHSSNLVLPLFLYMCMSGYGTSLTGMRQEMATAVAIWSIPLAIEKKWIKFLLVIWIAFRIHFVSILYLVVPFLYNKVWNGVAIIIAILALFAGAQFDRFGDLLLDAGDFLGFENYDDSILYGNSINVFRILVYCVSPISLLIKKRAISKRSSLEKCFGNLSIVAAGFVFLGLFGKANTFGRFGILFEPSSYFTIPTIVDSIEDANRKRILLTITIICFFIYYIFGYVRKGIWSDYYGLESISKWF